MRKRLIWNTAHLNAAATMSPCMKSQWDGFLRQLDLPPRSVIQARRWATRSAEQKKERTNGNNIDPAAEAVG